MFMQIFDTYSDILEAVQGAVVVIGNFDGVHRGHQALLARARDLAADLDAHVAVLTFEPHPRVLFRPDDPPFRITPHALKAQRLAAEGVEALFSIGFDWDFASQSPDDFIRTVLIEGIKPAHVVVGYDFRFGQMRKGTPGDIAAAGVPVSVVDEVGDEEGAEFSSSEVRRLLRYGQMDAANAILGWDWEVSGVVVKGDQRGRALGYPTANFALDGGVVHPAYGVYACLVRIEGEAVWRAAAVNIGIRPMFEVERAQVEAYLLDYEGDLYDKRLHVRPVRFLRGEAKFDTLDALIAQMAKDCDQARAILG